MIVNVRARFILASATQGDITIPISSFSARIRSGAPSYLSVVVPDYDTYIAAITARAADGVLYLYLARDAVTFVEMLHVNLEDIDYTLDANTQSISLAGHRTFTNPAPVNVTVTGYSYLSRSGNVQRMRCGIHNDIDARDRVITPDVNFTAGVVSVSGGSGGQYSIEVEELWGITTSSSSSSTTTTTAGV